MKQLFIGLDVHKKSWSVTVQEGQVVLKRFTMDPNPEALVHFVEKHYPRSSVECCYEACCLGYHIYWDLTAAGWTVLVVNPADIPRGNKQRTTKTDKLDSRQLARQLAAGHLKGIYVPDEKQEQFRSLFRRRNDLVKNLRRIKGHIKGMLLYYGVGLPDAYEGNNWSKAMLGWISKVKWRYPTAAVALRSRLGEYHFLHTEYLHLCNELRGYARKHYRKDYYLLRSVPGVGPFTAIALLSEVGDLRRFRGIDRLSSYVGLVPSLHNSGERRISPGLTFRLKTLLRSYLVEDAWVAAGKDPELMQYYRDHHGMDHRKIIVKIAAKLLSRIFHVVKSGEPYQIANREAVQPERKKQILYYLQVLIEQCRTALTNITKVATVKHLLQLNQVCGISAPKSLLSTKYTAPLPLL